MSTITKQPDLLRSHTVAIDGTLYFKYPQFKQNFTNTLQELHGDMSKMIQLSQVKHGSIVWGAIAAVTA